MKIFLIAIICFLCSCSEDKNQTTNASSKYIDSTSKEILTQDSIILDRDTGNVYLSGKEKFEDTLVFGKQWSEIEMSGDPDTALALFAYRIMFTDNSNDTDDCLSLMNIMTNVKTIKDLMKSIFISKRKKYNFDKSIDSLNKASVLHAKKIVEEDIRTYGESEGPCFELYESSK